MKTDSLNKIEQIRASIDKLKKEFSEEARIAAQDIYAEIFEEYHEVDAISWTQYTPYFNDGDACEFRVNSPSFFAKADDDSDEDEEDYYEDLGLDGYDEICSGWFSREYTKPRAGLSLERMEELSKACNAFESFLNSIEDTLQEVYGDHVQVIIYRDGTTAVEDYRHD